MYVPPCSLFRPSVPAVRITTEGGAPTELLPIIQSPQVSRAQYASVIIKNIPGKMVNKHRFAEGQFCEKIFSNIIYKIKEKGF